MKYLLILIVLFAGCRQTAEETIVITEVVEVIGPDLEVQEVDPSPEPERIYEVKRFESVEAYFKDANPNPLTYRRGLPNFDRSVSLSDFERSLNISNEKQSERAGWRLLPSLRLHGQTRSRPPNRSEQWWG